MQKPHFSVRLGWATLRSLALVAPLALGGLWVTRPAAAAYPQSAEGAQVGVATDHIEATRAAMALLNQGGNAIDAAVASALTLGVVAPTGSGLAGGGFALVYLAREKRTIALDFRESSPASQDPSRLLGGKGPQRGAAIGVPGEPAGLEWLSLRYGKKGLAASAAPAVALAEGGFFASRTLADSAARAGSRIALGSELSLVLLPNGQPVAHAARIRRPQLAQTLRRYANEGSRAIYTGVIADQIIETVKAAGGSMELSDLAAYKPVERTPLEREVDGRRIVTMPAPSAGGLMLLETLVMHGASKNSPLAQLGFGSSSYLHILAETMRGAVADRVRLAGDPSVETTVGEAYSRALDPRQLAARRLRIDPMKTQLAADFKTREQGTTHLIVVDEDGNVVSLTTTVNAPFGSGLVAKGSGLVLNDELDDFSGPDEVAGFAVVGLGPNRPRPNARPVSSMTPVIVFENGEPILAAGGSGGPRIATGVTQATLGRLLFGQDPMAAIASPRIHVSGAPDLLVDDDIVNDVRWGLEARGEKVVPSPSMPVAVQMIAFERRDGKRRILAAGDPRKGGFAASR